MPRNYDKYQRKEDEETNPPAQPRRGGRQGYSETVGEGEGAAEPMPGDTGEPENPEEQGLGVGRSRVDREDIGSKAKDDLSRPKQARD